jgi:hypothetical protein
MASMVDRLVMACPTPTVRAKRLANGVYQEGEEGLEKRCGKCRDYWPADTEFFYSARSEKDGLNSWCKACYVENRYPQGRRKLKPKGGNNTMSKNPQTAMPVVAVKQDWMLRIEAALSRGQKPEYDDLEQGIHVLLFEAAAYRRWAAESNAAFAFIDKHCQLIDVKGGVISIGLELDSDLFAAEGARAAISARIAVLQAASPEVAAPKEQNLH